MPVSSINLKSKHDAQTFLPFPKTGLVLVMWFSLIHMSLAQNTHPDPLETKDIAAQNHWVDSILSSMTVREKIGQLFMVAAFSNKDSVHVQHIDSLIQNNSIGGIDFHARHSLQTSRIKQPLSSRIASSFTHWL
jgi:hypothetical protein